MTREITIRLTWRTNETVAADLGEHDPTADQDTDGSFLGPAYLRFRADQAARAERLGGVLLPRAVRRRIVAELRLLDPIDRLRIRLRVPAHAPQRAVPLSGVPWERVRVPSEDFELRPDVWADWAEMLPTGSVGRELRVHPRFTVIREVAAAEGRPRPPHFDRTSAVVVVADATSVHGDFSTGDSLVSLGSPPSGSSAASDGERVATAVGRSRYEVRRVPSPATAQGIRRALPGSAVFYFGGHHIASGLVVAQGRGRVDGAVLDTRELSDQLTAQGVQLAVLMACDTADAASANGRQHTALPLAERLAADGVPYVVAVHGAISDGASGRFAGRFFSALALGTDIDAAVAQAAVEMAESQALPVVCTARAGEPPRLRSLLPLPDPVRTADGHRMPVPRAGARVRPADDERFRVCLETYLCLAGGGGVHVLADPSGEDLTAALTENERKLFQAVAAQETTDATRCSALSADREVPDGRHAARAGGPGWPEPPRWYACDAHESRPATRAALLAALTPEFRALGPGAVVRRPGLVVRWHVGGALPRWSTYLGDIRKLASEFGTVVIQVHGAATDPVLEAATQVARDLRRDEYLVAAGPPRPGTATPSTRLLDGAAQVLEALRAAKEGDTDVREVRVDGAAVVADLNANGGWGDWQIEHRTLESIAAVWPRELPGVLAAHANARAGVARYASLLLASTRDAWMSRWLSDAGDRAPRPSDFRGVNVPPSVADAVVLGLLREAVRGPNLPAELDDWEEESLSEESRNALAVWRRGSAVAEKDFERPQDAIALERAGLLDAVDPLTLDPRARCRGSWSLLVRRPLAEDDAAWLARASEDKRRLVGMAPPALINDAVLERELHAFTSALRLPLLPV
ncbi:CHAT domain-containing protein [Streptomyces sp. IBSBF 3136]|uniref:CHAT domain-containing protein n=1 Tax=Streptomyces sp. IBSBF 3136 TaxID=2903524 RepID=UPI002FDC11BD